MFGRCIILLALALAFAGGAPEALAAPRPNDAVARAETLYLEGAALYRARHYAEAVRIFERAYRVYPEPNLLYNMGRCYEAMGRLKDAIERYGRFAADNRSAPKAKKKARAKIAQLSEILAKTQAKPKPAQTGPSPAGQSASSAPVAVQPPVVVAPSPSAAQPPVLPRKPTRRFGVSKWLVGIAGLALAGGGVALFMWGHADHREVQDAIDAADGGVVAMPQASAAALIDDGDTKKLIGYAVMGAGGAALITSIVLFTLGGADEVPGVGPVQVGVIPGGAMLGVGGRF